jgi:hypothetical protein
MGAGALLQYVLRMLIVSTLMLKARKRERQFAKPAIEADSPRSMGFS